MSTSNRRTYAFLWKLTAALAALVAMFAISIILGAADTSLHDVWLAITSDSADEKVTIIRELRLPREVAAMLVGAALSVAGAIMQGLTRNPLADPGLLGLTAGANTALAVTLAIIPAAGFFGITAACFIGAAAGMLFVLGISAVKRGGLSPLRIVLAGAAVSAFLYAIAEGIGLAYKISKNVSMWTAGALIGTSWSQVQSIAPVILAGVVVALLFSRKLTILSLNEEAAVGLGLRTAYVKIILYLVVILLAGASVALIGNMVFVGLMIPHIVRAIAGTDYRAVLPMSAVLGAVFMLLADTLARTISAPYEAPLIAIVAILGLPMFLVIVRRGVKSLA